jgi:tellurite resistance protein
MMDRLREMFTPQQRRIIGAEAQQLLDNRHFREAFEAVDAYLVDVAKGCDPDNKEKASRVVISMQLLDAIKREIVRKVEDGEMAKIEMAELEKRNRPLRFVR